MIATVKVFCDRSGIALLALALLLAILNSMLFTVSAGLPFATIVRAGLFGNLIAAAVAWIILVKGTRKGVLRQLVAAVLLSLIHYCLIVNIWSVVAYGL